MTLLEALYAPAAKCDCGHHVENHVFGFSNVACMWCECTHATIDGKPAPRA